MENGIKMLKLTHAVLLLNAWNTAHPMIKVLPVSEQGYMDYSRQCWCAPESDQ